MSIKKERRRFSKDDKLKIVKETGSKGVRDTLAKYDITLRPITHGSIANLPPNVFWERWSDGNIQRTVKENRRVKFKLKIPYYQLSGKVKLREASCLNDQYLDGVDHSQNKVNGAITKNQP